MFNRFTSLLSLNKICVAFLQNAKVRYHMKSIATIFLNIPFWKIPQILVLIYIFSKQSLVHFGCFTYQCTKLRQRIYGDNHEKTQTSLNMFAEIYAEVGKSQYTGLNLFCLFFYFITIVWDEAQTPLATIYSYCPSPLNLFLSAQSLPITIIE